MKPNLGSIDKILRVAIGIALAVLFISGVVEGTPGILLLTLGFALVVTALISHCPLYAFLRISTCPPKKNSSQATD